MKVYLATCDMNEGKAIFKSVEDAKAWLEEVILRSFEDDKPEVTFEEEEEDLIFAYVPLQESSGMGLKGDPQLEGMIEEYELQ